MTTQENISASMNKPLRSISRTLALSLTLTVIIASTVMFAGIAFNTSINEKNALEKTADDYVSALSKSLEVPLWNIDRNTVKAIGESYAKNELVQRLKIQDESGAVFFSFERKSSSPRIIRSRQITHMGHGTGHVEISLTTHYAYQSILRMIKTFSYILLASILSLLLMTWLLLRHFLEKPLTMLGEIVGRYSSGNYALSENTIRYREFQPIVGVLNEMGSRITSQMDEILTAEKQYREIFENAAEGIFRTSPKGHFINANPAMASILGYDSPEELMAGISDIKNQLYADQQDRDTIQKILREQGTMTSFAMRFNRKDSSRVWVSLNVHAVKDTDGRTIFYEGMIEDITERKHAEEEKKSLEQSLTQAQKMESIGTLAGGIAHDFNNLLAAIIGYTELAMDLGSDRDRVRKNLTEVLKASNRAKDLVRQILTFSRKTEVNYTPVAMRAVVKESLSMMRHILPSTIEINQDLKDSGLVLADSTQINQVIINLCTNAAHAIEDTGGKIHVSLKRITLPEDRMHDLGLPAGNYLKIEVTDTGHGMSPDTVERIFDPYFTTKEKGRGTGLGLAVVLGIVKGHRGAITCRSALHKGTTFDVYFPEIGSEQDTLDSQETLTYAGGTEKILYVDDEPVLTELAHSMLSVLGYSVYVETDSAAALELIIKDPKRFDMVITDMTMPGMTGDVFAGKVLGLRSDMPVILCTGYSEKISDEYLRTIGVKKLLMKPFTIKSLSEAVRSLLDRK